MSNAETNVSIIDGYLGLLENLSPDSKLELISKLSASMRAGLLDKKSSFKKSFGALVSDKTAEEIIEEIRNSRTFTREIEPF